MNVRDIVARVFKLERPGSQRMWLPQKGVRVTNDLAMYNSVFMACLRIIGESMALLPWHVYQKTGKRTVQVNDDLDYILHTQANPEMTAFTFRETIIAHAISYGNGYAEIERNRQGQPLWLWLLPPDRITPARADDDNRLVYLVKQNDGTAGMIEAGDMLHIKGLGFDGLSGYNFVDLMKRSLALGMNMEEFADSFYVNGANVGGVIESKTARMTPKAVKTLLAEFNTKFSGASKAFRTLYLDNGMEFKPMQISQKDAQFFESRKLNVEDIARPLRIPLHMLADLDHATFTNIEQQSLEFVVHCLLPWITRVEQETQIKLIGRNLRYAGRFTRMNVMALLRGDQKSRFDAYAIGRQWGFLSVNDIMELEDRNPIGAQGDIYLTPSNMVDSKTLLEPKKKLTDVPAQPATEPTPQQRALLTRIRN